MTTLTTNSDGARIDRMFAAVIGICADFCGGARQGGYPLSPPSPLAGRRR